jgi:hypothetical protein
VLKAYVDQGNPALDYKDKAVDFFDSLDNGRYAQFKADIHNAMTSGMMKAPHQMSTRCMIWQPTG